MNSKSPNYGLALLGCGIALASLIALNLVGHGNGEAVTFGWPLLYLLREQNGYYDRFAWGDGTLMQFTPSFFVVNGAISLVILPGVFLAIRRSLDVRFSIAALLSLTTAAGIWLKSSVKHQIDFPYDFITWVVCCSRSLTLTALALASLGYAKWLGQFHPRTTDATVNPTTTRSSEFFAFGMFALATLSLLAISCRRFCRRESIA